MGEEGSPGAGTEVDLYGNQACEVRVWWEPTDDRQRSGFAGAWWPAKVLGRNKNKLRVKYDNGEEDDVLMEHVSPLDTLPVKFGEEEYQLAAGEFCEVFNGSETDPCAWLGRVMKLIKSSGHYMVAYPFHDAKPERIEPARIRRARIMEDGEWRLIKPNQEWEDGEVTSPAELELIHEDELWEFVEPQPASSGAKRARSAGGNSDSMEIQLASSSSSSSSSEEDDDDDADEGGSKKKKRRKSSGTVSRPNTVKPAKPADVVSAAGEPPVPHGMLRLYITFEPTTTGMYCLMPVMGGSAVPPHASPVYFPLSALAKVPEAARMQLIKNAQQGKAAGPTQVPGAIPGAATGGHKGPATGGAAEDRKKEPPKRYKTSWNCFVEIKRKEVADQYPGKTHQEVLAIMGGMWRNMRRDERALYEAESHKAKTVYLAERARYIQEGHGEGDHAGQAAAMPPHNKGETLFAHQASRPSAAPRPAYAPQGTASVNPGAAAPGARPAAASAPGVSGSGQAGPNALPGAPVPARTAKQMYTAEFIKALAAAPGLAGPLSQQTALTAASSSWTAVEPSIKAKYEEKAAADAKRYERELALWQKHQEAKGAADKRAPAAAGKAATASTASAAAPAAATVAAKPAPGAPPPAAGNSAPPSGAGTLGAKAPSAPGPASTAPAASAAPAAQVAPGATTQAAPTQGAPAPAGAAVGASAAPAGQLKADSQAAGTSNPPTSGRQGGADDVSNVDEVLGKGLDLKAAQARLSELGYLPAAHTMLMDVWRKDSPRLSDALKLYKKHLHLREAPDWDAFMQALIGPDKLQSFKAAPK